MSKFCPVNPEHDRFITGAVICQDWIVDGDGNFFEVSDECTAVFYKPDPDNEWECAECGAVAEER